MPKLTNRERLAELEQRQKKLAEDVDAARRALREKYALLLVDLPVEVLSEREFRDIMAQAVRVGGSASLSALKALPPR